MRNEVIRGRANTRHEESMLKQRAASLAKSGPQLAERPRGPDLAITGAAVSERGYAVQKCVASSLFLKASLDGKRGRSECEGGAEGGHCAASSHAARTLLSQSLPHRETVVIPKHQWRTLIHVC